MVIDRLCQKQQLIAFVGALRIVMSRRILHDGCVFRKCYLIFNSYILDKRIKKLCWNQNPLTVFKNQAHQYIVPNGSPNTSSKQTCQQTNGHTKVRYFSPCLSQWRAMICNTVRLSAVWHFATFGRQMQRLYWW